MTNDTPTSGTTRTPQPSSASLNHPLTHRDAAGDRLVIGMLIVAAFVVILNETIMSVALPTLIVDLRITAATAQWLTSGFMLAMAVLIPTTGFLLQRFTTRFIFLLAMSLFSAGTLLAAISPDFWVLLVARVVQASGTAMMLPLLMTTAMTLATPSSRGRMMGNISIVISVAPAIGPTVSGAILSALSWRFMFIVVLPIAIVVLVIGAFKMKNVTEPRKVSLDALSVVLSAFAFGGLLYGLSALGQGDSQSREFLPPLVSIAVGIAALALFILRQMRLARKASPLLDLRAFRSRNFTLSVLMFALAGVGLFGSLIVLPIYAQSVLGLSPLETGLLLLPGGVIMGILSPAAGRIYDRVGPTALLVVGSLLVSGSLWTMTLTLRAGTPAVMIPIAHIVLSIGLALTFTPLFTVSLGSLAPSLYSHGSAILSTVQQVAGGMGTALFVTLLSTAAASRLSEGSSNVDATAAGVHSAFLVGALVSLLTIIVSFFVRSTPAAAAVGVSEATVTGEELQ